MSFRLNCQCGTTFTVSSDQRGQKVACPGCGKLRQLPLEKPKPSATKTPFPKQVEAPIAAWKSKRKSSGKVATQWIVSGLAVLGLILGVLFFLKDSPDPKTVSQAPESATENPPATPKPSINVPVRENKPQSSSLPIKGAFGREDSQPQVAARTSTPSPAANKPEAVKTPPINPSKDSPAEEKPTPNAVAAVASAPAKPGATPVSAPVESVNRTPQEVLALINQVGRTPPDWYEATPLNYPKTLDLTWPQPPPKGWNNQKNVGQFIWDVINPNPGRWQQGVRFMHHLLMVNKDDRQTLDRIMTDLGRMYHELLQDYARAAFWYRQAGIGRGGQGERNKNGAHLAECYWRLGNRQMAVELLEKLPLTYASIKLWGDLGETEKSVQLARRALPSARFPAMVHLMIGDAYRLEGDYRKALAAYEKALSEAQKGNDNRQSKFRERASANIAAIKAVELLDLTQIPNGTYRASSIGYEAQVEIEVRIQNGRIDDLRVTKHREKQFYSSVEDTPRKIIKHQGIKNVDSTSGATITSEAIINATAKALAAAMKN